MSTQVAAHVVDRNNADSNNGDYGRRSDGNTGGGDDNGSDDGIKSRHSNDGADETDVVSATLIPSTIQDDIGRPTPRQDSAAEKEQQSPDEKKRGDLRLNADLPWLCDCFNSICCELDRLVCVPLDPGHPIASFVFAEHIWAKEEVLEFKNHGSLPFLSYFRGVSSKKCVPTRFQFHGGSRSISRPFPLWQHIRYWQQVATKQKFLIIGGWLSSGVQDQECCDSGYLCLPVELTTQMGYSTFKRPRSADLEPGLRLFRSQPMEQDLIRTAKGQLSGNRREDVLSKGSVFTQESIDPTRYIFPIRQIYRLICTIMDSTGQVQIDSPQGFRGGPQINANEYTTTLQDMHQAAWTYGLNRQISKLTSASKPLASSKSPPASPAASEFFNGRSDRSALQAASTSPSRKKVWEALSVLINRTPRSSEEDETSGACFICGRVLYTDSGPAADRGDCCKALVILKRAKRDQSLRSWMQDCCPELRSEEGCDDQTTPRQVTLLRKWIGVESYTQDTTERPSPPIAIGPLQRAIRHQMGWLNELPETCVDAFQSLMDACGSIDAMVNNMTGATIEVGAWNSSPATNFSDEAAAEMMQVVLLCTLENQAAQAEAKKDGDEPAALQQRRVSLARTLRDMIRAVQDIERPNRRLEYHPVHNETFRKWLRGVKSTH
ncbi:hypothetical protein EV356DRAFT_500283 [Viridothelium virens]|uniref:Uncharacterized protein n=1 Tax=Viridothelium virens TaxID=1048519 RepID=A0A6A6HC59_VIRVR|nr:hypothetical protein EV356DRAFT_500283 [Viridothelium virens]